MPLEIMKRETPEGSLHQVIQESHSSFETIKNIYALMGRNIKKKTLLLMVPHSKKGFGSKKSAKGKLVFRDNTLDQISVKYETVPLYPNMIDPSDVSIAKADDTLSVEAKRITDYDYSQTPSSPQFALYCLLSPENASVWHGVGKFAGSEVVKSFISVKSAYLNGTILKGISSIPKWSIKVPLQFNLVPGKMWIHPKYKNIDASLGCIKDVESLVKMGMNLELLNIKGRPVLE